MNQTYQIPATPALSIPTAMAAVAEVDWASCGLIFTLIDRGSKTAAGHSYYGFKTVGARNKAMELASRPGEDFICPFTHGK